MVAAGVVQAMQAGLPRALAGSRQRQRGGQEGKWSKRPQCLLLARAMFDVILDNSSEFWANAMTSMKVDLAARVPISTESCIHAFKRTAKHRRAIVAACAAQSSSARILASSWLVNSRRLRKRTSVRRKSDTASCLPHASLQLRSGPSKRGRSQELAHARAPPWKRPKHCHRHDENQEVLDDFGTRRFSLRSHGFGLPHRIG